MTGLTEAELDELSGIINDTSLPEDVRLQASQIVLSESEGENTTPRVAELAQQVPIPQPEGLRDELLSQAGTGTQRRSGGPPEISATPEFRAKESLSGEAAKFGVFERLQEIGDFFFRGVLDEGGEQELAKKRAQDRSTELVQLYQKADALGMSRSELMKTASAAGFAPDVVIASVPMFGSTTPARIGAEMLTGGILMGSEVPLGESAVSTIAASSLGFGLLGLTAEIGQLRRIIANDVQKALKQKFGKLQNFSRRTPFQPTEASRLTGINQSVGETTSAERLLNLEKEVQSRKSVGGPAETFVRQRELDAIQRFKEVDAILDPAKLGTPALVAGLRVVRQDAADAVASSASATWRETLAPALEGMGAKFGPRRQIVGGPRFIRTDEVAQELRRIRATASAPITNNKPLVSWADEQLELLASRRGVLTIGEYQEIVSGLGKGAISDGVVRNTDSLIQAMKGDLSSTRAGFGDDATDAVIDALGDANAAYRAALAPKDEINAIYAQKLGLGGDGLSTEEFATRFLDLPASQKEKVFADVARYAPELAQTITARTFSEGVKRHSVMSTMDEFLDGPIETLDLVGFARDMGKRSHADMKVLLNIPNLGVEQSRLIVAAFDQLAKLSKSANTLGSSAKSAARMAEQTSINIMSRDLGFISRLAAGELTPGALERWLYTEKGLNALLDLGRSTLKPRVLATQIATESALLTLMGLSEESDIERAALEGEIERTMRTKIAAGGRRGVRE